MIMEKPGGSNASISSSGNKRKKSLQLSPLSSE